MTRVEKLGRTIDSGVGDSDCFDRRSTLTRPRYGYAEHHRDGAFDPPTRLPPKEADAVVDADSGGPVRGLLASGLILAFSHV
jgi:hypothetical protein